jgi:hypothetical protein
VNGKDDATKGDNETPIQAMTITMRCRTAAAVTCRFVTISRRFQAMTDEDTGTIAEVPEVERIDIDEGEGANALEGGDDSDAADQAFRDPGKVKILGGDR